MAKRVDVARNLTAAKWKLETIYQCLWSYESVNGSNSSIDYIKGLVSQTSTLVEDILDDFKAEKEQANAER